MCRTARYHLYPGVVERLPAGAGRETIEAFDTFGAADQRHLRVCRPILCESENSAELNWVWTGLTARPGKDL